MVSINMCIHPKKSPHDVGDVFDEIIGKRGAHALRKQLFVVQLCLNPEIQTIDVLRRGQRRGLFVFVAPGVLPSILEFFSQLA